MSIVDKGVGIVEDGAITIDEAIESGNDYTGKNDAKDSSSATDKHDTAKDEDEPEPVRETIRRYSETLSEGMAHILDRKRGF